ncbi:guanine-7 methyltransferase, isoform CRA_d [Linderina pennispora]|uniref:mRNA cap guanine-N(7) methyltransferase n=1 Tax=Linderina pennispora TaxID=61395 RepID=A0A1Y1WEG6_9FUNG|nr:guanine-7 methyltransferase, isoform CRA_d [Linderina pennispora]ORX71785.1 guanine-7 methyltransferase, isoform CRA_d [Linderina pennispora]
MNQSKRKYDDSRASDSEMDDAKYIRIDGAGDAQAQRVKALSNAEQVAAHYNSRRELGVQGRLHTAITGLRIFNNWVKSIIIRQNTFRGCKVLDLGCGKGGDLRKWSFSNIGEYVGMDIAGVSVNQAHKRYLEMKKPIFPARFYVQDCYGEPLEKTLQPPDYQADVISAQFCLHYAFESEKKARQMMHNVSSHLASGGRFIFTIPNANWLIKKLRSSSDNTFGNSVYRVEFQRREPITRFGFPYSFTLDEAVEDCTEYIVHFPSLVKLAEEHGMRLVSRVPFHEFYASMVNDPNNVRLLERMGVVTSDRPALTDDEWEAVGIYMAVTLEKA